MAHHAADDDDAASSRADSADLAFDVGSVHCLPDFAEQPDLEDIDEYNYEHTSLDLTVAGGGSPGEGAVWLGKGDTPRYPQSAPRPPPRYRREGKAREVGEGLKEAGDDEAMVAIYRSSNGSPAPTQDPVWDAARTIELCVHRLREVRVSSISGVSGRGSPKAQLKFSPPALELTDMGQDSRSKAELSRRVSFERVSELADEARRARAEEAKAKKRQNLFAQDSRSWPSNRRHGARSDTCRRPPSRGCKPRTRTRCTVLPSTR